MADDLQLEMEGAPGQTEAPTDATGDSRDEEQQENSDDPLANDEDLQQELYQLYLKCCGEDRYPRLVEVKDVKQAEFYWGGRQYVWWSSQDKTWQLPTQAQAVNYGDLDLDDMPRFEFVTNIYQSRGLMVIGAVSSAPPRIRFFPNDSDDEDDLETAEGRTKLARLIQRWNPPQRMLQDEVYHAWTGGVIAYWARFVSNEEKEGLDSIPALMQTEDELEEYLLCPKCNWSAPAAMAELPVPCPQCGTQLNEDAIVEEEPIPGLSEPEGAEELSVQPAGRETIAVYGALNFKRPQHVQNQSQYHYCAIEEEIHYSILRAAFPSKSKEIKAGMSFGADDIFERNARLSVAENTKLLTQTGSAQAALCTFARIWFRQSAFWMIDDEQKRDQLRQKFPTGCRVEFCGKTYCRSAAQSMDDCIVVVHAMPGRGQHRNGIGTSMLSLQDRVNTFTNIEAETYEYGIPITYRASDTFDSEADESQRAAPGLEVETALGPNQDIRQRIMQVRADSVSPDMAKHTMDLIGPVSDDISGAYPALSGSAAPGTTPETLGQQAMQRDQAMGRMGIFYVNLKQGHADIMTIACRDLEAHSADQIFKLPTIGQGGDFESESVDISALEGEAQAYPEGDENFPELWNQQRATMMQAMQSPYGQAFTQDPANAELFTKLLGIPDLRVPGVDSQRKQLKEIAEIIAAASRGVAAMVEVDQQNDEHEIEAATCKNFINSSKGQRLKRENQQAFIAISAHRQQHIAFIPKPQPPVKPLSESVTAKLTDLPPAAIIQILSEWGIQITEADILKGALLKKAEKTPTPKPGTSPQGAPATAEPQRAAV